MTRNANANSNQNAVASLTVTNVIPVYGFVIGMAIIILVAGAGLIGTDWLLNQSGMPKTTLIWFGLAIAAVGAVLDSTLGSRRLLGWLRPIVLDWQGLLKFSSVAVQLGLLVVIIRMCHLEHAAFFQNVMVLTFFGFIIHYFLPLQYRQAFFVVLSVTAILSVLGPGAWWLIGISLLLISLCHLPIPYSARVVILLGAGILLMTMRADYLPMPWSGAIWPILGSMFMFRLIIYMFDLKHKKAPFGVTQSLSYFFLLPNVAFPLFPAVDYATFCRTYYNEDRYRIYQTGLKWMLWGVAQLLVYRYINYYWVIGPDQVNNTSSLVQYMLANYFILIRVSGQFHIIVGILHLFGFNLPRTWNLYYLASSFTDFWRRVNIYWKDLIQKVFYFPTYFRMRNYGETTKLVVATTVGFAVTWFLHSYQWFWIRGSFLIAVPDMLFWFILGVLVLATLLFESRFGKKRTLVKRASTLRELAGLTLRTSAVFTVMMVLWSIWISPTMPAWFSLISSANLTIVGVLTVIGLIIAVLGVAIFSNDRFSARAAANQTKPTYFRSALPTAAAIAILFILIQPQVEQRFGGQASELIADMKTNRLNAQDTAAHERSYYEKLTDVNNFNLQLWDVYSQKPDDWIPLAESEAAQMTGDFKKYELMESVNITFKGAPLQTNRWGMRDDDYDKLASPGTYRIAVTGASIPLGSGVKHEDSFEFLLEQRLNRDHAGGEFAKYELLNFSVGGYCIFQQMMAFDEKVIGFKPNALFFMSHIRDEYRAVRHLINEPREMIPFAGLKEILNTAGVTDEMGAGEARQLISPIIEEIFLWCYMRVVEQCREQGITPVWVCIPAEPGEDDPEKVAKIERLARKAGFITLDLTDVYDGHVGSDLRLSMWDKHPNPKGHRLLADRLHRALQENKDRIPMGLSNSYIANPTSRESN